MTDMEHWGVSERWNYPDDGYGDCEDYVLLKRRMLMQAGWPRQALLVTVVRDKQGDGHAVLTVKTDKGEFILDNQTEESPALVGDRVPLREAAVADRSQPLDRARRPAPGSRYCHLALIPSQVTGSLHPLVSAPWRIAASAARRCRRRGDRSRGLFIERRITRAGAPTISELSANSLPSVTTAPAPTRQFPPILAPLSTTAPMPMRLFAAMLQPCRTTLWPMTQFVADLERKARIGVQRGVVLDLRALAELDPFVVTAQHRVEPDAGIGLEPHPPDHAALSAIQ